MKNNDNRWEQAQRYADGVASVEDMEKLRAALRADATFRAQFLEYLHLDTALGETLGTADSVEGNNKIVPVPAARFSAVRWQRWIPLAAAACLTLLAVWWFLPHRLGIRRPVAVISRLTDAEWSGTSNPLHAGSSLAPGWIHLKSGAAQIEFQSGARVVLEGPAEFEVRSTHEAYLRAGRVSAVVPERAHGFTVRSHEVTVVDLGTEFGLNVVRDGAAEVHVFNGKVEVSLPDKQGNPVPITAGRAARAERGALHTLSADRMAFLTEDKLLAQAAPPATPQPIPQRVLEPNPAPAEPGGELIMHIIEDAIEVGTTDRNAVEVQVVAEGAADRPAPTIEIWREGTRYRVEANPPGGGRRYRVLVPRKFSVDLRTTEQSVTVTNLEGKVKVHTTGGVINLGQISGDVDADSASGHIALRAATGTVRLKTARGDVALGEAGSDASVETAGGSIKVLIAHRRLNATTARGSIKVGAAFGLVQARSSGGSVSVSYHGQLEEDCYQGTAGGSVEAWLPAQFSFDVKASSPQGDITTDLPIQWTSQGNTREGRLNGGGRKLTLSTAGGAVKFSELKEKTLPVLEKEFEFFKASPPGAAASAQTQPVKDEFTPASDKAPTLPAGLVRADGTVFAAEILSIDDTQVAFRRKGAAQESLLLSQVAAVLFRPMAEAKRDALSRERSGLLLRNGDFLEGAVKSFEGGQIAISSVLFGVRRYNITNEAMALVLQPPVGPPR